MIDQLRALWAQRQAALPPDTTCFRWVDHELPGLTVDVFGAVGVLSFYRHAPDAQTVAESLVKAAPVESIYVKHRPKEARRAANEAIDVLAPSAPLVGPSVERLEVREQGRVFEIRPANGLSVGLYLDAREARQWVWGHAHARRVLNVFAYTCGFGVAAMLGGASRAVNLDLSRRVLDWGEQNLALNGHRPQRADFIAGDAFEWLQRLAKKNERFELVVLDPPGFASSAKRRFSAQRDYWSLVELASPLIADGGQLLAMCNVEQRGSVFDDHLHRGLGSRRHELIERFGASSVDFGKDAALRCVAVQL